MAIQSIGSTYVEKLRASRNKAQVAFQEFGLLAGKYPDNIFCFFEGKDNAYYIPRIRQYTDRYYPIKCGGREKVLKVYNLIKGQKVYDKYIKAFFVDRDFNQPLLASIPPIYETPCYSIENLYVSESAFKQVLINEFHLSEGSDAVFKVCVDLFLKRRDEFHDAICLFNAWYACLIERRNTEGIETGVNLDEKPPKGFVDISLESVSSNYDINVIKSTFVNALEIDTERLSNKLTEFKKCECHLYFRGKYELYFLIKFIHLLLLDSNTTNKIFAHKINFSFGDASGINLEQALSIFSGYADTSPCLHNYLKQVIP